MVHSAMSAALIWWLILMANLVDAALCAGKLFDGQGFDRKKLLSEIRQLRSSRCLIDGNLPDWYNGRSAVAV